MAIRPLPAGLHPLVFEFLATLVLTYNVAMGCSAYAAGATLMIMVYISGPISGGHVNPVITLAALVNKRCDLPTALKFWVCQLLGALVGGILAYCFAPSGATTIVDPQAAYNSFQAFLLEAAFTFSLAWVVLNTTDDRQSEHSSFFGWAIGFNVFVGATAGAVMNPAVASGLDAVHNHSQHVWVYWLGPVLGALAAALVYKMVPVTGTGKVQVPLYESVATFFLCLAIGVTGDATAIGTMLAVQIAASGYISGGHVNPAVSACMFVRGLISKQQFLLYVLGQMAGGFLGAAVAWELTDVPSGGVHYPALATGEGWFSALLVELIGTFVLVTVISHVTSDNHPAGDFFPLCIGFAIVAEASGPGAYSGGAFNPTVGVMLPLMAGQLKYVLIYTLGPLAGGVLGGLFAYWIPPPEKTAKPAGYDSMDEPADYTVM